jgi:nitrite reductase (NADH) small subunit
VEGKSIAVFHQPDGIFAIDNLCPHRGAPLQEGFVSDGVVTCPWHQWQFDLKTGAGISIPGARVKSYPVRVEDGDILVAAEGV